VTYAALLEVLLKHTFYTDGRCPDLAVVPDAGTARLLRGHRCLLRPRRDGLSIVTPLDDAGRPFLPLPAGATLRFLLRLGNDDFALFTDLTAIEAIVATGARPAFVDEAGTGALKLVAVSPPDGEPEGVLAEIRIVLPAGQPTYSAAFQARRARWAYYCVTHQDQALEVVDSRPEDPIVFLAGAPGPGDPIAVQLEELYPGSRHLRFLSRDPVASSEAPRKTLELRMGTEILLHALPNPSPRSFTREVAGLVPPEYRLFQIVECDPNPQPSPG
jgi:hypothetical protein